MEIICHKRGKAIACKIHIGNVQSARLNYKRVNPVVLFLFLIDALVFDIIDWNDYMAKDTTASTNFKCIKNVFVDYR